MSILKTGIIDSQENAHLIELIDDGDISLTSNGINYPEVPDYDRIYVLH